MKKSIISGFTLIELLVVIAIVALIMGIALFGLSGARESGRDNKRRVDIESIRSALELYKADCNVYPNSITFGSSLTGINASGKCSTTSVYISTVPNDPSSGRNYTYSVGGGGTTYSICASLETGTGSVSCSGSCGSTCNYRVVNP